MIVSNIYVCTTPIFIPVGCVLNLNLLSVTYGGIHIQKQLLCLSNFSVVYSFFCSPSQKSPIPLNRYDDVPDVSDLQRPKKKVGAQYRGKARALYNFKAQNPKYDVI